MIFNQNIIFWLMLLSTQLTSVFQIHLNRFDHYQRRHKDKEDKWMLITVKALTLLSGGQNSGQKNVAGFQHCSAISMAACWIWHT